VSGIRRDSVALSERSLPRAPRRAHHRIDRRPALMIITAISGVVALARTSLIGLSHFFV
jgi:hypothetical protein